MAGRVASGAKPVVIQDLRDVELVSPHLRAARHRLARRYSAPRPTGRVIGVAHAGSVERNLLRRGRSAAVRADGRPARARAHPVDALRGRARRTPRRRRRPTGGSPSSRRRARSSRRRSTTRRPCARSPGSSYLHLADWCAVHIARPEGGLERVALAHADIAVEELEVLDVAAPAAPEPADSVGPTAVVRRGLRGARAPMQAEEMLVMYGGDAVGAAELERAWLCLVHVRADARARSGARHGDVRDRRPARRFDEADLALAEELARRAAVAVENALLYREAEERARAARVLAAVGDGVFLVDGRRDRPPLEPGRRRRSPACGPPTSSTGRAIEVIPGWTELARSGCRSPTPARPRAAETAPARAQAAASSGSRSRASASPTAPSTPSAT